MRNATGQQVDSVISPVAKKWSRVSANRNQSFVVAFIGALAHVLATPLPGCYVRDEDAENGQYDCDIDGNQKSW